MSPTGPILGLDPSSSCIGWGAVTRSGMLYEAGKITPRHPDDSSWDRIMSMHADLVTLFGQLQPRVIVVEWTKGKVGKRHKGHGAGLAVYGCGVGAAGLAAHLWGLEHPECEVAWVLENTWSGGVPKEKRQLAIATAFPAYAPHLAGDDGGDISDGIGVADWWRIERMAEGRLF